MITSNPFDLMLAALNREFPKKAHAESVQPGSPRTDTYFLIRAELNDRLTQSSGLSPPLQPSMGDAGNETASASITDSASRPAESLTLSDGSVVALELYQWGDGMWSAADANKPGNGGWGHTREGAIEDLRGMLESELPEPVAPTAWVLCLGAYLTLVNEVVIGLAGFLS
jgi:hypothetical protein